MDIKWLSSASDRKERCEQPLGCWDLECLPGAHSVLKYSKPPGHVLLVRPQGASFSPEPAASLTGPDEPARWRAEEIGHRHEGKRTTILLPCQSASSHKKMARPGFLIMRSTVSEISFFSALQALCSSSRLPLCLPPSIYLQ